MAIIVNIMIALKQIDGVLKEATNSNLFGIPQQYQASEVGEVDLHGYLTHREDLSDLSNL